MCVNSVQRYFPLREFAGIRKKYSARLGKKLKNINPKIEMTEVMITIHKKRGRVDKTEERRRFLILPAEVLVLRFIS
jgi:hypothetical protein